MTTIYRQGDVMLVKVKVHPEDGKTFLVPVQEIDLSRESRLVLAYGEVTGHAHAIYPEVIEDKPEGDAQLRVVKWPIKVWDAGAERYIQVLEKTALKHEEHAPVPLDPGIYKVVHQREYDPAMERRVAD